MERGESIFISGASRGIGLLLAEAYIRAGFTVIGCSRGDSPLSHAMYHHYKCNISDEESVKSMCSDLRKNNLVPKVLVNNAGIELTGLLATTKVQNAYAVVETNLLGTLCISKEMIKLMQRKGHGRLINFSSVVVPLGSEGRTAYSASKAGVEAMSYSLANECRAFDITINTIGISYVESSGMIEALSEKALAKLKDRLLKPELLKITEIVKTIDFFSSPEAKNITGQTIYFGGVR